MTQLKSKGQYFTLFSCCIPVKGASRTAVCDLQRNGFLLVPNVVHVLLTEYRGKPIAEIFDAFDHEHDAQILEYFDYLDEHEMGFYSDEPPTNFPELSLSFENPNPLNNCILERDAESDYELTPIVHQLSGLFCNFAEIRNYHSLDLAAMHVLAGAFRDSTVRGLYMVVQYHPEHTEASLREFFETEKRVRNILVHGHPDDERAIHIDVNTMLVFTKTKIESDAACGTVAPHYFRCTTPAFTESIHHNNCLHKKITVDKRGQVRNCPSLPLTFGDVTEVSFADIIARKEFTQWWNVTKDQVKVCQDCEFRYICHDCRAHLKNPEDGKSKPAKCNYDPYSATWETEPSEVGQG